jgi:hypothetical protein
LELWRKLLQVPDPLLLLLPEGQPLILRSCWIFRPSSSLWEERQPRHVSHCFLSSFTSAASFRTMMLIDDIGRCLYIPDFTAPICDLFIEIFELKENNWLRRQAIVIILQQLLGGTIERFVLLATRISSS